MTGLDEYSIGRYTCAALGDAMHSYSRPSNILLSDVVDTQLQNKHRHQGNIARWRAERFLARHHHAGSQQVLLPMQHATAAVNTAHETSCGRSHGKSCARTRRPQQM